MPKKTKKQKIIAQYRRKLHSLETTSVATIPSNFQTATKYDLATQTASAEIPATLALSETELSAIRKNMVKAIAVAMIAMGIEIALWIYLR